MKKVFVLGGARSGKSTFAEALLADRPAVDYVATAPHRPDDREWAERVRLHKERRPANWHTIESHDVASILRSQGAPVLVDCIGVWLTSAMDRAGLWEERPGAEGALRIATGELVTAWADSKREVVAVSNEVGMGVVPATSSGRRFRDDLGRLNMNLAATADEVYLLVAGLPQRLK